jgi:g-D-glutamyl-meso-diaminopimelate peptidase
MARAVIGDGNADAYFNREWKTNARGVDLNRNYDALWSEHVDGVGRPTAKNYKGECPGSEVETAALVRLTESLSNPIASICVHMQGEVIYWRCNQEGAFATENRRLAEIAASVTGYRIIDTNETEPSYSNWTILAHGIPTITVETGVSRYPLSYDLTTNVLAKNLLLWSAVAYEYATK